MEKVHGGDIYRNKVALDFSVNINPLDIPESVRRALTDAVESCRCYPDIHSEGLRHAISGMTGAKEEEILCGNGASELFPAIVRGIMPKKTLLPVPSFYGYERAAASQQGKIVYYEMEERNGFCVTKDMIGCLTEDTDLLFLTNPNNPVGNLIEPELLELMLHHCREKKITVVLDECFMEFTESRETASFLQRTEEFPNLIVVRAFTKIFAMPGVRLGYLVCGDAGLRFRIAEQLPEWNLSVFAQAAGEAAAGERQYVQETVEAVKRERDYLEKELQKTGIRVYPGSANYLLIFTRIPLGEELLKQGILIRDCSNFRGLSKGYYRIAVKQRADNIRLLTEIRRVGKKYGTAGTV